MNKIIIVSIANGIFITINNKNGTISGILLDSTYAIHFLRLSKISLPSLIPKTIELKSSVNN